MKKLTIFAVLFIAAVVLCGTAIAADVNADWSGPSGQGDLRYKNAAGGTMLTLSTEGVEHALAVGVTPTSVIVTNGETIVSTWSAVYLDNVVPVTNTLANPQFEGQVIKFISRAASNTTFISSGNLQLDGITNDSGVVEMDIHDVAQFTAMSLTNWVGDYLTKN